MNNLFENFKLPEKSRITNERQSIISQFVDEINKERPSKYKTGEVWKTAPKVTGRQIAVKLAIIKELHQLKQFYSECIDYRNRYQSFSKRFFGGYKDHDWNKKIPT